jgi:hypothetical protein
VRLTQADYKASRPCAGHFGLTWERLPEPGPCKQQTENERDGKSASRLAEPRQQRIPADPSKAPTVGIPIGHGLTAHVADSPDLHHRRGELTVPRLHMHHARGTGSSVPPSS